MVNTFGTVWLQTSIHVFTPLLGLPAEVSWHVWIGSLAAFMGGTSVGAFTDPILVSKAGRYVLRSRLAPTIHGRPPFLCALILLARPSFLVASALCLLGIPGLLEGGRQ